MLQFVVSPIRGANTKRQILSIISKIFDPLGLIGPIVTKAKLIMQETWRTKCNWNDPLLASINERWARFRQDLEGVENLFIPRRIISCEKPTRLVLQGFCDASEGAYGACLYVQAEDEEGALTSRLLIFKSPVKPLSILRLELCSAVLLTRLIETVRRNVRIKFDDVQAWSDSMVTLYWIHGNASRWKSFVANRVLEITQTLPAEKWNHVRGEENPADLISQGTSPRYLKEAELWWLGPPWLRERCPESKYGIRHKPSKDIIEISQVEERKPTMTCHFSTKGYMTVQEVIKKCSTASRIE